MTKQSNLSRYKVMFMSVLCLLVSCGSGTQDGASQPANVENSSSSNLEVPASIINAEEADFEVLLIGNSHSAGQNFPAILATLIEAGTGKTVNAFVTSEWAYLSERSRVDGPTLALVESRDWSHVVLQAQKYSTTGTNTYSTSAAEEWVEIVHEHNAVPVMYPEHPRKNNAEEGQRIYNLHVSIAQAAGACVAPVGPAWDIAAEWYPEMNLYHSDGNHFNLTGAFLSALIFYEVITGLPADDIPLVSEIDINEHMQLQLKQLVNDTIMLYAPCDYMP